MIKNIHSILIRSCQKKMCIYYKPHLFAHWVEFSLNRSEIISHLSFYFKEKKIFFCFYFNVILYLHLFMHSCMQKKRWIVDAKVKTHVRSASLSNKYVCMYELRYLKKMLKSQVNALCICSFLRSLSSPKWVARASFCIYRQRQKTGPVRCFAAAHKMFWWCS